MEIDSTEACLNCGSTALRQKLVLIDAAWIPAPGKDPRLAYYADLRVDDLKPEHIKQEPLQQFVDGYFCSGCGKAFVSAELLKSAHRRYK